MLKSRTIFIFSAIFLLCLSGCVNVKHKDAFYTQTQPDAASESLETLTQNNGSHRNSLQNNELTVMTFNIHAGKGPDGTPNLQEVSNLILNKKADIVLLQELDRLTNRSGIEDQFETLKDMTGYNGVFGKTIDLEDGEYGISLLTKYNIEDYEVYSLEVPYIGGWYEPRVLLIAKLQLDEGTIFIGNTHLHVREGYKEREAIKLITHIKDRVPGNAPLILGGDFNAQPENEVYRIITDYFKDSLVSIGDSINKSRIDYVFGRNVEFTSHEVEKVKLSDHYPIIIKVRIQEK